MEMKDAKKRNDLFFNVFVFLHDCSVLDHCALKSTGLLYHINRGKHSKNVYNRWEILADGAGLDVDGLAALDGDHLHEAAARSDVEELEGIPVGQLLLELLLVVELREVLSGVTAVAVEDDEEVLALGDASELVLAGILIRLCVIDRRILGNLAEAVPVIDFLRAERIVVEILANQPDIGLLVVELVLGGCEVPADATGRPFFWSYSTLALPTNLGSSS